MENQENCISTSENAEVKLVEQVENKLIEIQTLDVASVSSNEAEYVVTMEIGRTVLESSGTEIESAIPAVQNSDTEIQSAAPAVQSRVTEIQSKAPAVRISNESISVIANGDEVGLVSPVRKNSNGRDFTTTKTSEHLVNRIQSGINDYRECESSDRNSEETMVGNDIMISSRVAYDVALCLDKAKFCLERAHGSSWNLITDHANEATKHIETIKKIVEQEWNVLGSSPLTTIQEFIKIVDETFNNLGELNNKILACQEKSLRDMIDTMLDDMKYLLLSMKPGHVQTVDTETVDTAVETVDTETVDAEVETVDTEVETVDTEEQDSSFNSKESIVSSDNYVSVFLKCLFGSLVGLTCVAGVCYEYLTHSTVLEYVHQNWAKSLEYFRNVTGQN